MPVVRYAALAALVFWLGGTLQALAGDVRPRLVAAVCGGVMIVGLFIMKFVGPPPRAFVTRVSLAAAMIAVSFAPVSVGPIVTAALGLVLLAWYAHE